MKALFTAALIAAGAFFSVPNASALSAGQALAVEGSTVHLAANRHHGRRAHHARRSHHGRRLFRTPHGRFMLPGNHGFRGLYDGGHNRGGHRHGRRWNRY